MTEADARVLLHNWLDVARYALPAPPTSAPRGHGAPIQGVAKSSVPIASHNPKKMAPKIAPNRQKSFAGR